MTRLRVVVSVLLSVMLLFTSASAWSASSAPVGTVIYADRAHIGASAASVGATVFNGDNLSTDQTGSVQIRAGAARFLLSASSTASITPDAEMPAVTLTHGLATFSTVNAKAFAIHAGSAVIRPYEDVPTVGQITRMDAKQTIVKSMRGSLIFSAGGETRVIPEGTAYRIVEMPVDAPDMPAPAGAGASAAPSLNPIKAGRSKFIFYAIFVAAAVTIWAVTEAMESPARP